MSRSRTCCLSLALLVALPLWTNASAQSISTREVATGLSRPIWAGAPDGDDRLFVAQQRGLIQLFENGAFVGTFLDVSALILNGAERGLLGMTFHPDYANNGHFYTDYTRASDGATVVSRWQVSADPNVADASSEVILVVRGQPFDNHNAGGLAFGPADGYLYVTLGDGGGANDPACHAQNLSNRLGSILRIDVDNGAPIGIPPDNPFVNTVGARPEIFHYGLRNPWRISFDRLTGDLYIGDVGQDNREEISFAAAGESGLNFGWKIMEGTRCNVSSNCAVGTPGCGAVEYSDPVFELIHSASNGPASIIGGYVYRGCAIPSLQGTYFFADYVDDLIRSFVLDPETRIVSDFVDRTAELDPPGAAALTDISSFGEDGFGELLIVTRPFAAGTGKVFKLVPANAVAATSTLRNGSGANSTCYVGKSQPILGNRWRGEVDTTGHPAATAVGIVGYESPSAGSFLGAGELLVDIAGKRYFSRIAGTQGGVHSIASRLPCDPSLNGITAYTQAFVLGGGWELCNALDVTLGWY